MFTARHFEKTAQVVALIEADEIRYQQTLIWEKVFKVDNSRFNPDTFERRVEFLRLHADEFCLLEEIS